MVPLDKFLQAQIRQCHDGSLNDSTFGRRMKGEGKIAEQIHQLFRVAKSKYLPKSNPSSLNCELYGRYKNRQLKLF